MKNPLDDRRTVGSSTPSPSSLPPSKTESTGDSSLPPPRGVESPRRGCCICGHSSASPSFVDEPLSTCADCEVSVHLSCYGDRGSSDNVKLWRCRWCETVTKRGESKACVFCPLTEGAFTSVSTGGWAHVICCLFIPEVSFVDPRTMTTALVPDHKSFKALYRRTCTICYKGGGACRRCDDDDCDTHFHVTCAQALGLLVLDHKSDDVIKFAAYCQMHSVLQSGALTPSSFRWLPENSSALSFNDIMDVSSVSRKIVKKIIYRLAKDLSKTCPHEGNKGSEVNAWYDDGCRDFFDKHPNLNRKEAASYIRNCGLGFYHGCLKRRNATKLLKQTPTSPGGGRTSSLVPIAPKPDYATIS